MSEKRMLRTTDRELNIELTLEENTCSLLVFPASGEPHFARLVFTKGFVRELRNFLNASEPGESTFVPLG